MVNSHVGDMPDGCRRIHADRTVPGALLDALAPHRDEFDIVFDNTAYRVADLEPMIELFEGRIGHFVFTSSVAVYRRSFVQPVREDSRRHDPEDLDPRKAYGVGKVSCEDHLRARFKESGFAATSLRVTHTLGPRTPLVDARTHHLQAPRGAAPDLHPGRRVPLRPPRARAGRGVGDGVAVRIGSDRRRGLQRRGRRAHERRGLHPDDGAGSSASNPRSCTCRMDIARRASPPLLHWGEAIIGGAMFSIDKALAELDWRPIVRARAAATRAPTSGSTRSGGTCSSTTSAATSRFSPASPLRRRRGAALRPEARCPPLPSCDSSGSLVGGSA